MSENEKNETQENSTDDAGKATPWAGAADGGADAASEAPSEGTALAAENARLKDQLLRTLAEMENLRRRTEREIKDARTYGLASFARDMLSVADNLRRALEALPADARSSADAALRGLLDGVEMTERELLAVLERHQVRRIEPQGERFDPNFHQAMFEVADPQVPNGTVVQVVQTGYVIAERVLRPALVGVSKGGAKVQPQAQQSRPEDAPAAEPNEPQSDPQAGSDATEQPDQQPGRPAQPHAPGERTVGINVDKSA